MLLPRQAQECANDPFFRNPRVANLLDISPRFPICGPYHTEEVILTWLKKQDLTGGEYGDGDRTPR